jgi:hypothetical protein
MWVEDTDQQKLCKKQRKNKQNLKSQINLPPPPQQQQQHKHTIFFTKVQYRLLPSPKKIVQVFCNELMQQLLLLLWDDGVVVFRNVLGCGCCASAWGGYTVL